MEILIALLTLLLVLSFLLKGTFLPRWGTVAACVLLAVFVRLVIPWLADQPAAVVSGWLTAPDIILDGAVCLVLEAVLMIAFCFSRPAGRFRFLRWYPGLLAFPAVCRAWSLVLFSRPGLDFTRFAWTASLATLAAALVAAWLLRKLLPEEEIRLEGLFLINLFLLLATVAATGAITF